MITDIGIAARGMIAAGAALLVLSALPAWSQPAGSIGAWCRAHNSYPTAASRCIFSGTENLG
jgi:hypothetical protein